MPTGARVFIACTAIAGLIALSLAAYLWSSPDHLRFFVYLVLSLIASTLKVRLPGVATTMSASFLFVLIGIADFSLPETMVVGCCAALMQTVWRNRQYTPQQAIFNVGSWAISIALSYSLSHLFLSRAQDISLTIVLPLAAFLFFGSHTGLVSLAVAWTSQKSFADTWHACFLWTFPYYLVGAAIAGLCSASARTISWRLSVLVLPLMYLSYLFYRTCVQRIVNANKAVQPGAFLR